MGGMDGIQVSFGIGAIPFTMMGGVSVCVCVRVRICSCMLCDVWECVCVHVSISV